MKTKLILTIAVMFIISSCAVVPKESVELSATVGRDIVTVYESHKKLSTILFFRMKNDVNNFVNNVYAPYQIGKLLEADFADLKSGEFESMTGVIIDASKNSTDFSKQKQAISVMKDFVSVVYDEVEEYRKTLLDPIEKQESEVSSAIDRSYNQIIYANSIVTGHLASVRKVHDAQEEILDQFGLESLNNKTAQKLSDYATSVEKILKNVKSVDIEKAEKEIKEVQNKFNTLFKK